MKRSIRVAVVVTALLLSAIPLAAQPWPDPVESPVTRFTETVSVCGSDTPVIHDGRSFGPIELGQSLREIRALCREIEYGWLRLEGGDYPVLLLGMGESTLLAELTDTTSEASVHRMSTPSPGSRTVEGVYPSMAARAVSSVWPDARVGLEEGSYIRSRANPDFTLLLGMPGPWEADAVFEAMRQNDLRLLPADTYISAILLVGRAP